MAKYYLIIFIFSITASVTHAQSALVDTSISTLSGGTSTYKLFSSKKLLIIILPVTRTAQDSAYMLKLDSIAILYADRLNILGVLSYEDGYTPLIQASTKSWYSQLAGHITISSGMYTRKSSPGQSKLFQWLTHASMNGHFDMDAGGVNQKYLLDDQGNLYGVIDPSVQISYRLIQRFIL